MFVFVWKMALVKVFDIEFDLSMSCVELFELKYFVLNLSLLYIAQAQSCPPVKDRIKNK